jgi:beta-glucanase (GH16 family)
MYANRTPLLLVIWLLSWSVAAWAAEHELPLVDLGSSGAVARFAASSAEQVTVSRSAAPAGVVVTCRPGKGEYPGVELKPAGAAWDLSKFGHVEARLTNTGASPVTVCLRVDDDGDWKSNPWNAENGTAAPGETVTVRVRFGTSWGKPGYALRPAKVTRLLLFTSQPKTPESFRIDSIVAGGSPGEKPQANPDERLVRPKDGVLIGKVAAASGTAVEEVGGASATTFFTPHRSSVKATLPAGAEKASVRLKPSEGRWDLRDWLQVVVHARNAGKAPIRLKGRVESAAGGSEWVTAAAPMAPGASQEITLPFAGGLIILAATGEPKGGTPFESDRTTAVTISAEGDGERTLVVDSVRAVVPPPPKLPDWLGKRPPVPGEWKQTLVEEFNGPALNTSVWTIYHPNYWDKQAHFSKANVILGGGVARLRFEKKQGHENDDPAKPETDWATGFLTTTHKWTQRYGYFECRLKLPKAPGMWPAFWMMPDRGPAAGAAREDTRDGGMEFDILEYLSRYGPFRYNIACHWDGYEKDHRSNGTDRIYVQPDKEGFYTAGLLWEPGRATFYCNGTAIAKWEDPRVASVPEYILFTAVSGGWGGNDLTGEGLPDDLVIDYVRAWQRADLAARKER